MHIKKLFRIFNLNFWILEAKKNMNIITCDRTEEEERETFRLRPLLNVSN